MNSLHEYLPSDLDIVVVQPGDFYSSGSPVIIQTLLGSCVSACLYDCKNNIAGLNHFLLAAPRYPKTQPLLLADAGRYGINSMELLINDMMKKGARRHLIRAKVFGAANILNLPETDDFFKIAEINQRFIMEFLVSETIPLVAADLGGIRGRVIYFNTQSREVSLRYIPSTMEKALEREERKYWHQKKISQPEETQIFIF